MTLRKVGAPGVLITGASTGIGLEFARQYAARGWQVVATYRGSDEPETLVRLGCEHSGVQPARMDVTQEDEINKLAEMLSHVPLDVVINNAGITHDGDSEARRQNFGGYDYSLMERIFATNVRGPLMVSQALAGNLERGNRKTLVTISSAHGSLTDPPVTLNELQGVFYCASKAALNRQMQVLGSVLATRGIKVLVFNPGAVWTERYEVYVREHGDTWPKDMFIMPEVSVAGMISAIDSASETGCAQFLNHDGSVHPW